MTKAEKKAARMAAIESKIKKIIVGGIVGAAVLLAPGFYKTPAVVQQATYKVQRGDVLRNISEAYLRKNTYDRRYILEFEEEIHRNNPWIRDQGGVIYPGQIIVITYRVNAGEA